MKTLTIARNAVVVIVEDDLRRRSFFLSANRIPSAYLAHEPQQAIQILNTVEADVVFLDFDLALGVDSRPVAEHIARMPRPPKVFIHSENPFGAEVLQSIIPSATIARFQEFEIIRD